MGGLLPSWNAYSDKRITEPADAAKLWEEIRKRERIPITGDIWLDDPLMSSYPPSIAFKAAQRQDKDKAVLFLRRLKEMLFMEKKNINKWENLETAALFCGLDAAVLEKQMSHEGHIDFQNDLKLAKSKNIKAFPTLIFNLQGVEKETLVGIKSYETIVNTVLTLIPEANKNTNLPKPNELFKLFNTMTENEFSFFLNLDQPQASAELNKLQNDGIIVRSSLKEVDYWQLRKD